MHPGPEAETRRASRVRRCAHAARRDSRAPVSWAARGPVVDRRRRGQSMRRSTRSGTCRCRPISSATTATPIAIATRRSSRGRADRLRRRRPACISRRRSSPPARLGAWRSPRSRCMSATAPFNRCASSSVEDHRIEPERYEIGRAAADAINSALAGRRRIVAVGTTTTRTLEAVAREHDGRIVAGTGWAGPVHLSRVSRFASFQGC